MGAHSRVDSELAIGSKNLEDEQEIAAGLLTVWQNDHNQQK